MLQLALALWASVPLAGRTAQGGVRGSGLLTGAAVVTHNSSLFLLPALALLLLWQGGNRLGRLVRWLGGVAASTALGYGLLWFIFPTGWADYLQYLAGIAPPIQFDGILREGVLAASISGFMTRITSDDIQTIRVFPVATSSLGIWPAHFMLGLAGFCSALLRDRRLAMFALAWPSVFVLYELSLRTNIDAGTYLVFLLPVLCVLASTALWSVFTRIQSRPLLLGVAFWVLTFSMLPSLRLTIKHWGEPAAHLLAHYSDNTLAAMWVRQNLADDVLMIQSRNDWNVNLLPYYSKRKHAMWRGKRLFTYEGFGHAHTPLNASAFALLTTERLTEHLAQGGQVYALDANPLAHIDRRSLDPRRFEWSAGPVVPLAQIARDAHTPAAVQARVKARTKQLFRLVRAPTVDSTTPAF